MAFQNGRVLPRTASAIEAALAEHASQHAGAPELLTLKDQEGGRPRKDGTVISRYQCCHAKSHECRLIARVVQGDNWARVDVKGEHSTHKDFVLKSRGLHPLVAKICDEHIIKELSPTECLRSARSRPDLARALPADETRALAMMRTYFGNHRQRVKGMHLKTTIAGLTNYARAHPISISAPHKAGVLWLVSTAGALEPALHLKVGEDRMVTEYAMIISTPKLLWQFIAQNQDGRGLMIFKIDGAPTGGASGRWTGARAGRSRARGPPGCARRKKAFLNASISRQPETARRRAPHTALLR